MYDTTKLVKECIDSIMHHEGITFLKLLGVSPSLPSLPFTNQQHSGCPTVAMYWDKVNDKVSRVHLSNNLRKNNEPKLGTHSVECVAINYMIFPFPSVDFQVTCLNCSGAGSNSQILNSWCLQVLFVSTFLLKAQDNHEECRLRSLGRQNS